MILGSAPVPYISVWVLIPSMLGGGDVIADALVSGTSGIGVGVDSGVAVAVGVGVDVGTALAIGVGVAMDGT
jgi:hypothetical protein